MERPFFKRIVSAQQRVTEANTKVMRIGRTSANSSRMSRFSFVTAVMCVAVLMAVGGWAQEPDATTLHNALSPVSPPGPLPEPFRIGSPRPQALQAGATPSASAQLYRQLRDIHLDATKYFRVREASIEREDLHIT